MLLKPLAISTLLLGVSIAQASAPSCANLYSEKHITFLPAHADARSPVKYKATIPTTRYIRGLQKFLDNKGITDLTQGNITWHTYESLNLLKSATEQYLSHFNGLTPAQKIGQRDLLMDFLLGNPNFQKAMDFMNRANLSEYKPGEYELRLKLLENLFDILKIFPPELRPKVKKIPWDERRNFLDQQTDAWMEKHVKAFDEQLYTMGYKSYEEYVHDIRELGKTDPDVKAVLDLFDQDQIIAGTRVREGGRFWVPTVGLQNVFVANTSAGGDTNNKDHRANVESVGTGISRKEFDKLDDEIKPKYGVLNNRPDGAFKMNKSAAGYGTDFYIFKEEIRNKRMSVYFGDSFGLPSYVNNFPRKGLVQKDGTPDPTPKSWRGMFIPWSRKLILAPYMIQSVKEKQGVTSAQLPVVIDSSEASNKGELTQQNISGMFEVQAYGRMGLDQVESFVFHKTPPSGKFLKELQDRNIEIYDARLGNWALWWEPNQ